MVVADSVDGGQRKLSLAKEETLCFPNPNHLTVIVPCKKCHHLRIISTGALEHTPDPQLPVFEGNPFIFEFWVTGYVRGSVGIFFEINRLKPEIQAVQSSFTGT